MKNRLRIARAERDVNQREVAAALGCGLDRYWRIENGWSEPTEVERKKLSRFLRQPVDLLFPPSSDGAPA